MNDTCRKTIGDILPGATIVALAIGLFLNSLPGTFIVDDWPVVADSPRVANFDLRGILTNDYWGSGSNNRQYRPLTVITYAVNRALFTPDALSFHVVNILLHAAACLALYSLSRRLAFPPLQAWLAAALFAAHPVHLEAVNVIVGRAELLAALFGFLFLILARSPSRIHRASALACLLAALLSKESAAVFPLILAGIDLFTGGSIRTVLRNRWKYYCSIALLVCCWGGVLLWVYNSSTVPLSPIDPRENPLISLPPGLRILSALKVQFLYLARLLAPVGLHGVYEASLIPMIRSPFSIWGIAVVLLACVVACIQVILWRRRHLLALGILIYLAGFLVTSNLFFLHYVMMADRLAYLPSAGFCLALSVLFCGSRPDTRESGPGNGARRWRKVAGFSFLAALCLLTVHRNPLYREPARLWEGTLAEEPANAHAWVLLGDTRGRAGDLAGAEAAYRSATRIAPDFYGGWDQLAYVLLLQGRAEEAIDVYRQSTVAARRESAYARLRVAQILLDLDRPAEALRELAEVAGADVESARLRMEGEAIDRLRRRVP